MDRKVQAPSARSERSTPHLPSGAVREESLMNILIDCDVLLDVATERPAFVALSRRVLDWSERHPGCNFVAWHTIANLFYLSRKSHGAAAGRQFIHDLLVFTDVVPTGTAQAKHALSMPMT